MGAVVSMVSIPVTTMEAVRSMGGSRAFAGIFKAVAPSSTKLLPTTTVVIIPEPPVAVTNGCPVPNTVMTGSVTSGAENRSVVAAAAATTAAVLTLVETGAATDDEVLPPPPPLLPPPSCAASPAASAPQFPLTLHANVVLLQVLSSGPQGSYTVSNRTPVTDWLAASEAV